MWYIELKVAELDMGYALYVYFGVVYRSTFFGKYIAWKDLCMWVWKWNEKHPPAAAYRIRKKMLSLISKRRKKKNMTTTTTNCMQWRCWCIEWAIINTDDIYTYIHNTTSFSPQKIIIIKQKRRKKNEKNQMHTYIHILYIQQRQQQQQAI